jgi:hypothetical protein
MRRALGGRGSGLGLGLTIATLGATAAVAADANVGLDRDRPHAPLPPVGCQQSLRAAGVRLTPWPLRAMTMANGVVCEAPDGIAIRRGPALGYQPAARVNCAFALRLLRFEAIVEEEARRSLGGAVRAVIQLGTYNCRQMAAYPDLVSEHSFANAIDIAAFVLANGRRVVVEQDWVPADRPAPRPAAEFLRRLTRRLYDEGVFSVVLTPSYDRHHKNHLHLDGAAYSVDGT